MGRVTVTTHLRGAFSAGMFGIAVANVTAQCAPVVHSAGVVPGLPGTVNAVVRWDPDGAGPLGERWVFGGMFQWAGDHAERDIAVFDPATDTWSGLGSIGVAGTFHEVRALAVLANGDLVAGGRFTLAGGTAVTNIARFDGAQWQPLGGGVDDGVLAMAVLPSGDLIVGGRFTNAGGAPAAHIARWDGAAWHPLGTGADNFVIALEPMAGGAVAVGGWFGNAGGVVTQGVASWHPVAGWQALGGGVDGGVNALCTTTGGDLVVGGGFTQAGGAAAASLARWDGASWTALATSISNPVSAIAELPGGELLIGGGFVAVDGVAVQRLARWDGAAWHPLGGGVDGPVLATTELAGGDVLLLGQFTRADGLWVESAVRWGTNGFARVGDGAVGVDLGVTCATNMPNGDVVIGGTFGRVADIATRQLARWDGQAWYPLGGGVEGTVRTLAAMPNGDVVVAGDLFAAGGQPVSKIARWDGQAWSQIGAGLPGLVFQVVALPNGELIANSLGLKRWDGQAWSPFDTAPLSFSTIGGMTVLRDGRLALCGYAVLSGGWQVAIWDGTTWTLLPGIGGRAGVMELHEGSLLAFGQQLVGGARLARWDGATWTPVGPVDALQLPYAIAELPGGDLLVAGEFSATTLPGFGKLGRWDGVGWTPVLAGTDGAVNVLLRAANDEIVVGGTFRQLGGVGSSRLGWWRSSCPAGVAELGGGCGGVHVAAQRPWLGGTWTAAANGIAPGALVVQVFGAGIAPLALGSVLPAQAGCQLLVSPDALGLALADATGGAAASLALPNTVALVGAQFDHQVVPMTLDAAGAITDVTASNAVQLTLGGF